MGLYRQSSAPSDVREPPTPQYSVFYFDKAHRLAWCPIYKAASTTWLYHLCVLNGLAERDLAASKKQLSELARSVLPELDFLEAEEYADDHWIPYHLYCTPCLLQYDILAKVETLQRDQVYALRSAGVLGETQPRWMHRVGGDLRVAKAYFSQLDAALLKQLHAKYALDFELFGYSPDEYFAMVQS
ncbi:Carbohydrate sulfotransferase [Gryllus bimaculatus]|nr:Carbohydrate sulfotransferase [Gryllus bimaculatus]